MDHPLIWLVLTLIFIVIQGFFAMSEMAAVSFDKVRLDYLVEEGKSSAAKKLDTLLKAPSRLFGTTLIAVDTSLVIGSECSRNLYAALGLSPEFAPLTQVAFVVIFAELVPMFAARRHSQQVALFVAPVLYACSHFFKPLIFFFSLISQGLNSLLKGKKATADQFLSREELQNVIQHRHGKVPFADEQERIDQLIGNIFDLSHKSIKSIMLPLKDAFCPSCDLSVKELCTLIEKTYVPCFPICSSKKDEIKGVVYARDLIGLDPTKKASDKAYAAWFMPEETSVLDILKKFQTNKETLAIIADSSGKAVGLVRLENVIEQLLPSLHKAQRETAFSAAFERTLSCDMTLREFSERFSVDIKGNPDETLGQLITMRLGHLPHIGEKVHIGRFEMTVIEANVFSAKKVSLRSLRH